MKKYEPSQQVLDCIGAGKLAKAACLAIDELGEAFPHDDEGAKQATKLLTRFFSRRKEPPQGITPTVVRDRWRQTQTTPG
jgi:hypothetical protein